MFRLSACSWEKATKSSLYVSKGNCRALQSISGGFALLYRNDSKGRLGACGPQLSAIVSASNSGFLALFVSFLLVKRKCLFIRCKLF